MSLVFIRIDKIGDLIATLSVDQHSSLTQEEVHWVVAQGLEPLMTAARPQRKFMVLPNTKANWQKPYAELLNFLKLKKPRAVIVFYAPWWVSMACWSAGIPLRIGRASQWHSYLFFNRKIRQSRSQSEMHEHDYNQKLVELGLGLTQEEIPPLKLVAENKSDLLKQHGLKENEYFVIHPGMFGSALNWPQKKYNELIQKLIQKSNVVVTGTQGDENFLNEIKAAWKNNVQVTILQGKLNLSELLSVLSSAKATVAPSTGVLHLSAALGKKSVGIYSPILAHHPKRWGPRGLHASFIVPDVKCPAKSQCLEGKCHFYPCMEAISVESILQELDRPSNA